MENLKCLRCNGEWSPRSETKIPKNCPKCNSPYWNTPRKNRTAEILATTAGVAATPTENVQLNCRLKDCGHTWTTRGGKLPSVCPKCHSKNWNAGIAPSEAKDFLRRMYNMIGGDVYQFAEIIGMSAPSLAKHLRGEPMTLSMLESVADILRSKGYTVKSMEQHAEARAKLEALIQGSEDGKPTSEQWEAYHKSLKEI